MTTDPLDEPLHGVAVYNPGQLLSKQELIGQFVVRTALLDSLVDDLRRVGTGDQPQHHLLVGQRGMGKTTILRRLKYAIEDDPALRRRWLPLVFPEEQYNVVRLSDLYVNWLDALNEALHETGNSEDAASLDESIDRLSAEDEQQRAAGALALLATWAKRLDRGLLLLLDNLDLMLARLKEEHWALREVLSAEHWLVAIGTSSQAIEATYQYDQAFYDFFQFHDLRGLTVDEMRSLLVRLAEVHRTSKVIDQLDADPGRMRTLHVLTGGNPRTIVLLYEVLATGAHSGVRTDLDRLLDRHTPLYKARFEALSTQAQQIVDALALHWHPITASELASKIRLSVNAVSSQLDRLVKHGLVEKVPYYQPESRTGFQIAERFFNIWYLMRASRRVRRKLIWLVEFLRLYYGREGLRRQAKHFLRSQTIGDAKSRLRHAEYGMALSEAIEDLPLRSALESASVRSLFSDESLRGRIRELIGSDVQDTSLLTRAEHLELLEESRKKVFAAKVSWPEWDANRFWHLLSGSIWLSVAEKAKTADQLAHRSETDLRELITTLEEECKTLVRLFGSEAAVDHIGRALREGFMTARDDFGGAVEAAERLGLSDLPAIAMAVSVEQEYDEELVQQLQKTVPDAQSPYAWCVLGNMLRLHLGRYEEAEEAYHRSLDLNPQYAYPWISLGELLEYHSARYKEAEAAYRKAIEANADLLRPWYNLGKLLQYRLGRDKEAERAYRKAIEIDPKFASAQYNLGNLLQDHMARYEEAEKAYRKAIELDSEFAHPWHGLGNLLHYHLARHEEAESAYRRAVEINPRFASAQYNLGNLLQDRMARYDEAEKAYRKAIELDSEFADPWHGLGNLLQNHLGRYDEAEKAHRKAIQLDPNFSSPWNGLGVLCQNQFERYDEAEQAYRTAIELDSKYANPWNNLGNLLQDHFGRYDEAEQAYRTAIELDRKVAHPWNGLGVLLQKHLGRYDEAERAYRTAIELDPEFAQSWHNLGVLLEHLLGRYDEAEQAYRKATEWDSKCAHAWNSLGGLLKNQLGRYKEAEVAYRNALRLDSRYSQPWNGLGNLLTQHLGRHKEAEGAYRTAIELAPQDGRIWNSLAWLLYRRTDRLEEAEQAGRRAVELAPDSLYALHTLATILVRRGKWHEADGYASRFLGEGTSEFHEAIWDEMVLFFREGVAAGHAAEAGALLDQFTLGDRWLPLRAALAAIEAGTGKYLRRFAPEVRHPAEQILKRLQAVEETR